LCLFSLGFCHFFNCGLILILKQTFSSLVHSEPRRKHL
jgi:hypothetical protein